MPARPVPERLRTVPTLAAAVAGADVVIETVIEVVGVKQDLFADVASLARSHAILASTTSVIPIMRLGERLDDDARGRLWGTHWWNPPHLIPLVEVVRTASWPQGLACGAGHPAMPRRCGDACRPT